MAENLKIIPLGGFGEIGMNMLALECEDEIIVIDAGLMFPDTSLPGIDYVIPDISYLKDNMNKVKAFVITHGHEDHIGALPFILPQINVPIYAPPFATEILTHKFTEANILKTANINTVTAGDVIRIGNFEIEYIHVCHSTPHSCALAIKTPQGIIMHSGDFKFDVTPSIGKGSDYARLSHYGKLGVKLLLSDSTNIEREGESRSEIEVGENIQKIFKEAQGRVIISTFASNIGRISQILEAAEKTEKKVILNGMSMVQNIEIAKKLKLIKVPSHLIKEVKEVSKIPRMKTVILTTGSQGEPLSALSLISTNNHKYIKIQKDDLVMLSSRIIPGHEKPITNMINHFYRRGAKVITVNDAPIHVSGHASKGELRKLIDIINPEYFIPLHGEYRHMSLHADLGLSEGIKEENIKIIENGMVLSLTDRGFISEEGINTGRVLIDGKGIGDIAHAVIKDRHLLAKDGIVVIVAAMSENDGSLIYGPQIITKGLLFEEISKELLQQAQIETTHIINSFSKEVRRDSERMKEEIHVIVRRFFNSRLERKPIIVPIVIEI